jgi:lysine 2,3-aminomutase
VLFEKLDQHAPNILTYRVGTRLPLHAPERIDDHMLGIFQRFAGAAEIALHVNHSLELFPEVVDALRRIRRTGARMYNHTVLLRGVNDNAPDLIELCERLRSLGIENHYLFHCIPMAGMSQHRTSVARGLALARELANSGWVSGRSRPVFALLTAVGKVVPYEGTIVGRDGSRLLLQTEFNIAERMRINPSWRLPSSAFAKDDGRLLVWYEDGTDE